MTLTGPQRLACSEVDVHFDGLQAIGGVDLHLGRGEILGLIGPNGAGKTTLVNVITGFQKPTRGSVTLDGRRLTGRGPARVARAGVARTFQAVRLFPRLTCRENVEVGAVSTGLSLRRARRVAEELLERFGMAEHADREAASLPYGLERRLGILRALAGRPAFMLLDEPAAGLNESESRELVLLLERIRDDHELGLLVIEHDMSLIMRLCSRLHVLNGGTTLAVGTPQEIRRHPAVLEAYLGHGFAGQDDARDR
jgi:branched-chain amino acid transport system ATP-binding protein